MAKVNSSKKPSLPPVTKLTTDQRFELMKMATQMNSDAVSHHVDPQKVIRTYHDLVAAIAGSNV